jgi:hypothetical protein
MLSKYKPTESYPANSIAISERGAGAYIITVQAAGMKIGRQVVLSAVNN